MKFYFDEMMPRPCARQLIARGHEVTMANDVGMTGKRDLTEHLVFATRQGAALVTCDRPFAGKASQQSDHSGLVCWTGVLDDIGGMVCALNVFANERAHEDASGHVFWIK